MNKNKPVISEIKLATLSVENLERSITFYGDVFKYIKSGTGSIEGKEFEKAWRMPEGLKGRCAIMGVKGINSGMLRLVQFDKPGERIWADYSSKEIIGHYAVNFGVNDLNAFWPRLIEAGAVEKAPPKFWEVNDNLSVWDSQAFDLDGILLDIFQIVPEGKDMLGLDEHVPEISEVQTVSVHVSDALRTKAFYQRLGFNEPLYETMVENLERFFEVPAGTKLHNINLMNPAFSRNGRVEIVQYIGFKSMKLLRERSVPPNIGILSISFETNDIVATCKLVKDLGGQEISEPVQVVLPKLGKVKLATFFGPDGEALEFYQAV